MTVHALRPTVRHGELEPLLAILPVVGAVRTQQHERPSQLAFVEDGVRVLNGATVGRIAVDGWPTLSELFGQVKAMGMESFACLECAEHRSIEADSDDSNILPRCKWVPSSDLRLPLHCCEEEPTRNAISLGEMDEGEAAFLVRVRQPT